MVQIFAEALMSADADVVCGAAYGQRSAAMPHPLRGQPHVGHTEERLGWVNASLHSVYNQPDAAAVHAQFDRILDALIDKLPRRRRTSRRRPSRHLGIHQLPPKAIWRQIWSTTPKYD
jgi:Transposase, Mutator family